MKEYYVIKNNGVGMIEYATNKEELKTDNVVSVTESDNPVNNQNNKTRITDAEVEYYEKIFQGKLINKENNYLSFKVNKLIKAINKTKRVSTWERNFIYSIQRLIKNDRKISDKQNLTLTRIMSKVLH
ncbi:MAG: hypothetical protein ACOCRX_00760 [Candidatus Woesearchaeota archaeon]